MVTPELIISQHGLRKTTLRLSLLTFFIKNTGPRTLPLIKQNIKKITDDRVTLYRELERLVGAGVIDELMINGESCYELAEKHHHHAVCDSCQKVVCLPCSETKKIGGLKGWKRLTHQVVVNGLCGGCNK